MTTSLPMVRGRLAAALLGTVLVVSACGGSTATDAPSQAPTPAPATSAPVATPTPTASPAPTASPTPAPTEAPSASAAVDPAAGLAIASPYKLAPLDPATEAAVQGSIEQSMGAFSGVFHVGMREITKSGVLAAYVMVMLFPAGTLTDTTYKAALGGITGASGTSFKASQVAGTSVSVGTLSTVNAGIFKSGDALMMVLALAKAEVLPIAKALITAN
jgi:hypothetical protein